LAVANREIVQVTRLPLQHKICKIGMICSAKPVLTEDLCVVQKLDYCSNILSRVLYATGIYVDSPDVTRKFI
jgi:hypothetical protein